MPIKFRCKHCRQFLGISRSKAGKVVDCPTCGRSVRVPDLDGSVEPISEPKLDLEDSGLASALDQLASIGEIPADEIEDDDDFDDSVQAPVQPVAPAPKPEPIPVEPPPPVQPIAPPPVAPSPAPPVSEERDPIGTLAGAGRPVSTRPQKITYGKAILSTPVLATLVIMSILFFGLGLVVGKSKASKDIEKGNTNIANVENNPTTKTEVENTVKEQEVAPALKGRITYETVSGDKREDWGARVIIFPMERKGSAKLSVAGFRAADTDADLAIASAAMQALGGAMTKVADDGTFEISLETPGSYKLLVISHFQSRDETAEIETDLQKLIEKYFERTDQLLGKVSYQFSEINYKGDSTQPWDHSFERIVE